MKPRSRANKFARGSRQARPLHCLVALIGLLSVFAALPTSADEAPALTKLTIKNLKFRPIGPANTGGRVTDIAVDARNNAVIYVGEATGGLYKTDNGGVTWENVFAKQPVASVGAVAVAPSKPDDVWVGTGEANTRNSVSWGNGVYVSHDGGGSWDHTGLETSRSIGRVLVDPKNPSVVWVAALGNPFAAGGERGVYKTTDGGKTWTASLKTDDKTGAVDLAMDPSNASVVFAAMYARRRNAYSYVQGSPADGIYRTTDGGATWVRLQKGLPPDMQRVGLAVAPSNHRIVYAVIDSSLYGYEDAIPGKNRAGGIFRSIDAGNSWERRSDYDPRPFYFSQIRVDPKDTNRIYELNFNLATSSDGGKNFKETSGEKVHSDWHALWIDPRNSKHMIAGTDGGMYYSDNRGQDWRQAHNMATGEFYTATYDYAHPYDTCGGMQDNYSWCGPHTTLDEQGITNSDWIYIGFSCDGFYVQIDPRRPWMVWDECQGGSARRLNLRTGERMEVRPEALEGTPSFRFNWNTPLVLDRFDPDVLYMGGNHLFKLTAGGRHGQPISPDLSKHILGTTATAGSAAENYGTIVTIAQSTLDRRIIWVGTDDGNVQLTRDAGASWTNVTAHLPAEVRTQWVSRIDASHFAAGRAYVAVNGHYDDDFRPHFFVTDDFGVTWRSLSADLPADGPANVIREDPYNPNLLFAGTEFALYVSIDHGAHWLHMINGLPTVAVDDVQIHPRDRDLIVATHGAAMWILDDIEPLESLSPQLLNEPAVLFDTRRAYTVYALGTQDPSQDEFAADNAPAGAIINYYIKEYTGDSVSITIKNSKKEVVRKLDGVDYPGINRVTWDLHPKGEEGEGGFPPQQRALVSAGTYSVTLSVGKTSVTKTLRVEKYDPGWAGQRMRAR